MRRIHNSRQRRQQASTMSKIFALIGLAIVCLIVFGIYRFFAYISLTPNQTRGVILTTETPSLVSVELENNQWNANLTNVKLYPGNKVRTESATAELALFEDSRVALAENTTIEVIESSSNDTNEIWQIALTEGQILVETSSDKAAITHTSDVLLPQATVHIPGGTKALFTTNSISVIEDESEGVIIESTTLDGTLIIGEGQTFTIPESGLLPLPEDNYSNRNALDTSMFSSDFIAKYVQDTSGTGSQIGTDDSILTILEPADNSTTESSTVTVEGTVNEQVDSVLVNGFEATITNNSFSAEVALEDTETVITVSAIDANGQSIEEKIRTVNRDLTPLSTPTITNPVANGGTYTTADSTVVINGTVPSDTASVQVNDYELQLFTAGQTNWQYLAQSALGNLVVGQNVYTITAINSAGVPSAPATVTIIYNPNASSNSVQTSSSSVTTSSAASVTQNPSALTITGPSTNGSITTSDDDLLLEGTTNNQVMSVWVNDYQLQLFEPSKQFWNYIANAELGTLQAGVNTYTVEARDANGSVIDSETYTITYQPE